MTIGRNMSTMTPKHAGCTFTGVQRGVACLLCLYAVWRCSCMGSLVHCVGSFVHCVVCGHLCFVLGDLCAV